ncbi:MAG TPA: PLD nuclease N-terminal domain-containing protein [Verrucomicrobiota bacterium]|nr:PLD nuclease N-terminal domain-containing protein [Verrucomicrobiota bacterium]HNU49578.1 PLD nuclease N-terminal domain-containing protein [Verrucomicrobiota bacterium]
MTLIEILLALGAAAVLILAVVLFLAIVPGLLGVLAGAIPFLLAVAGLYSCLRSKKPRNVKVLWVIIIVLAPILGPLLWFLWGSANT